MEPTCVPYTELPHTSKLFGDFLYHFDQVAPFYGAHYGSGDAYHRATEEIAFPPDRRAALVQALREENGPSPDLDLLSREGAVAVVTGQQVGLFTGPCYAVYKALTAIRLARRLSEEGTPAVPVFWLATEDHDEAEVNHCWGYDAERRPLAFRLATGGEDRRPVGEITLNNPPLNELRSSVSALPFGDEVAAVAELSYLPGRKLGEAFEDLLRRVLSPHGLLFVDPLRPAFRRLAAPLIEKALEAGSELDHLIQERNRVLESQGYHTQVHFEADTSLYFLLENGRRTPLRRSGSGYRADDRLISSADLMAQPERISPNALLRPVVQDYMLPTVALVGGPAEIAYLAQSEVLYQRLLGRMPVVAPRCAFTLLDSRSTELLAKYDLSIHSLFHGREPLQAAIAQRLIPGAVGEKFRAASGTVEAEMDVLRSALAGFDPTLAEALDRSRSKILYQLSKIERKAAAESFRRDQRAAAEAEYLSNLIYPHKHLQERFYTLLPFLATHGLDLVSKLYEHIRLDCPDHIVLSV